MSDSRTYNPSGSSPPADDDRAAPAGDDAPPEGWAARAPATADFVHRAARTPGRLRVVLLHGFMGEAGDLAPFASSVGVDAEYVFPHGVVDLAPAGLRGRAWWAIDAPARAAAIANGPRDLSDFVPDGIDRARTHLTSLLDGLGEGGPLVIGGFSQGAMLACDWVLRDARPVAGLVLFSGARIAKDQWRPLYPARRGLPVFLSHGRRDDDLSFEAADSFRRELAAAGWDVAWTPFDGGHEIPLPVWRAFRRWLTERSRSSTPPAH